MAGIYWSNFEDGGEPIGGDQVVGLRAGRNVRLDFGAVPGVIDQNTNDATLEPGKSYICNNGANLITFTLPAAAALGDVYEIVGGSDGGWTVTQNDGQQICVGDQSATVGVAGSISSVNQYSCLRMRCIVPNTSFVCYGMQGNITII